MKILVVGKGGREHAILTAISESPSHTELFSFPGSDAIFDGLARPLAKSGESIDDVAALVAAMSREGIDLCVAGEESWLVRDEGLANACAVAGIPCWGPPKEAAQLEASKEFAKEFLVRHGIPTGGYAGANSIEEARAAIEDRIVRPTVEGLIVDELPYRGFLYFGLMLTKDGPKVIEYNCRFGDPEAEAVLPMVRGDFAAYLLEAAKGNLRSELISFADGWSLCLVSASAGYPASSRNGDVISGLDQVEGARVFHAGTRRNASGQYETAGGRVLVVSATGSTRAEAVAKVYAESDKIDFPGRQRRSDIGTRNF